MSFWAPVSGGDSVNSSDKSQLVSIITPSFNQASFIEDTIESVVRQDYENVEYIVVDGNSTDGSVEIIKSYAEQYPQTIRWISEEDEGQVDAINKGFHRANGEIVAWLNSDDAYFHRQVIKEVVLAFEDHRDADLIYGDAVLVSSDNQLLKVWRVPDFDKDWLLRGCRIIQPALFFRRSVVQAEQMDPSISVVLDYEFWLRLAKKGYSFVHVPRIWAVDRNQPNRKILTMREDLERQKWNLRRSYGQKRNFKYRLQRLGDQLKYGLPGRLKGVLTVIALYTKNETDLVIPLKYGPFFQTLWQQLFLSEVDLNESTK